MLTGGRAWRSLEEAQEAALGRVEGPLQTLALHRSLALFSLA